jgi:AraC-like DNA-binding protein
MSFRTGLWERERMTAHTEIDELAETIERRMAGRSGIVFVRPKVSFARATAAARRIPVVAPAGIALLAHGSKRLHVGARSYCSHGSEYSVSTTTLPGEVEVFEDGTKKPLLGMTVEFDWTRVGRLLLDMEHEQDCEPPAGPWLAGQVDRSVARAFLHVAQLACSDREWDVLGEGALRELYYWALRSEAGPLLRNRVVHGASLEGVGRAVRFVEAHLSERLDVPTLAKVAAMSPSGLYARFSEALGQSPMQFVKRLRLEAAKSRIAGGERVTTAALEVGYASPSQFSRDFQRQFGLAPSHVRSAALTGTSHPRAGRGRLLSRRREG